jgi:nucleoside-diphosphate-sugar epimerase
MPARSPRFVLIAGSGFIGSRVAVRLADQGGEALVHHTRRSTAPSAPGIVDVPVEPAPPPILGFPRELLEPAPDAAVHFYCMGAPDAAAFLEAFDGRARRLVLISSCDVYRAYGRFLRTEPGPPDPTPLDESAPLRGRLHPYRAKARSERDLEHWYEKIEAERIVRRAERSSVVVLRLPKVHGEGKGLETVYGFAEQAGWRWTHGHAENVAAAISLAAIHPSADGEVFNLGEAETPTMGERLALLPRLEGMPPTASHPYDFAQDLHFDTMKIRRRLGYSDPLDERAAMREVAMRAARA